MTFSALLRTVLLGCLTSVLACSLFAQEKSRPCSQPQYRQLDFWMGDFDAFDLDAPSKVAARAQITGILGGCVIHEDYQQVDGLHGESYSMYDASRDVWHQTWVTNRGQLLVVEGKFENGALTLAGVDNRNKALVRVFWKKMPDYVHEKAETSTDGGKTWKTLFDMGFRPHK